MPHRTQAKNSIYISERMQEQLRLIEESTITSVVAPMGYGKTTAVNWFLNKKAAEDNTDVLRVNIYSDSIPIFWNSFKAAFGGINAKINDFAYPDDKEGIAVITDYLLKFFESLKNNLYIFIDDFHLINDKSAVEFLCALSYGAPEKVHIIIAGRDRFIPPEEIVRLGRKLHRIGIEHLKMNHTEIAIYTGKCGLKLNKADIEKLSKLSEGWFSAVYLNIRSFIACGELLEGNDDIYDSISAALIDAAPAEEKMFIFDMGLADEFSVDMAAFITGNKNAADMLKELTEKNAFVTRLANKKYRFHHMLMYCAKQGFDTLDNEHKTKCIDRYGIWHENNEEYLQALKFYRESNNFGAYLRVIQKDAGVLLAVAEPEIIMEQVEKCPKEILKENPWAVLVLMRRMFTWRKIPKMLELRALLEDSAKENTALTEIDKNNILGESDLIMSFLRYNDIAGMSALHRSASRLMTHPAVSIKNYGSWTFGSPSVLMMFHRTAGRLSNEIETMNESMPYYYSITGGHGKGAELIMEAEAAFERGDILKAEIGLERARQCIAENGLLNMDLCCDFLELRISLHKTSPKDFDFEKRRMTVLNSHDLLLLNLYDSITAYYYALTGQTEKLSEAFKEHTLDSINYLNPAKPMMELIENRVYLVQGEFTKVIGRSDALLAKMRAVPYSICELHILIHTAGAYNALGQKKEAVEFLNKAAATAEADEIYMPFVENYEYIKDILGESDFESKIKSLADSYSPLKAQLKPKGTEAITDREFEIALLMAQRLTGREIAAKMYLSEGTVKQYINHIYSKMGISGSTAEKRKKLYEIFKK